MKNLHFAVLKNFIAKFLYFVLKIAAKKQLFQKHTANIRPSTDAVLTQITYKKD